MTDTYQKFLESKTLRAKERGLSNVPKLDAQERQDDLFVREHSAA